MDIFLSYNSADRAWANWVAWTLKDAGHRVRFAEWELTPGSNFIAWLSEALATSDYMVALWSPNYFPSEYIQVENRAFLSKSDDKRLIPILVEHTEIPPLYKDIVHISLIDCSEKEARHKLAKEFDLKMVKDKSRPPFPEHT